ncbi:MAG: branched-chain amino acid ABC transporter ATP-binding protein/permease [Roseomonas sp.]|nr:branched-chain amino acid ABC transporter ATP-binding protein/permease [Roseomonas sp.]
MSAQNPRRLAPLGWLLAIILVAAWPSLAPNPFFVHLGQTFAYTAIAVIGLNILLGLSGQMSLGQAGFYAIGAYGSAITATSFGWPLWLSMPFGLLAAGLVGVLLGLVALRTRGLYLAMATLAFGFIVEIWAQRAVDLTGGTMGLFGVPQLDFGDFRNAAAYTFWICAAALLLVQLGSDWVFSSGTGRKLRAIKESESFAQTVGLNVSLWRTAVFTASALLAGLAGILFAHQSGFVSSDAFSIRLSIALLIAAVIGGLGDTRGPLLGTAILVAIAEVIAGFHTIGLIIYGGILLAVLLLVPEGAVGMLRAAIRPMRRAAHSSPIAEAGMPQAVATRPPPPGTRRGGSLEVVGLSKSYAGVVALRDVSFSVAPGTIHALIGPNGAGKSTLINCVAGLYRADMGSVHLGQNEVTSLSAHQRARLGLARSFQNLQLISGLTVIENVMLGLRPQAGEGGIRAMMRWVAGLPHEEQERARALAVLDALAIAHLADRTPAELPYGHRKLVELARALAQDPLVMLLDEPVAGLNPLEAQQIATALRRLRDSGKTILLVEHNMEFVMGLSDRVTVLDHGVVIADDTPLAVQGDKKVIAAYLGVEDTEAPNSEKATAP